MKRFLSIFIVCLMAVGAFAADMPRQGFGLQIGYAQPTVRLNSPSIGYPKDSLVDVTRLHGFKVGFVYDGSFIKGFGASMGFNYTFAMDKSKWEPKYAVTKYPEVRDVKMYHQVEIFVDWQYKFEIAKETYLMLFTGPTIQYGILYNSHRDEREVDGMVKMNISQIDYYKTTNEDKHLRNFNVTWGVGAGFQYKRYFLRGGYDFGLINPYKNDQFTSIDNRNTRGRFDQWEIKLGVYLWYED